MRAFGLSALLATAALFSVLSPLQAASIPVFCDNGDPTQIGTIDVNPSGTGISGGFTSMIGSPASLTAAAQYCGEHHFNWYQVVTADNQAPPGSTPPYIDVPPGGYPVAFDSTWADNLPWYYDEDCCVVPNPLPPGRVHNPALGLGANTTPDTLNFGDFPGGGNGLNLSFKTWLVSLFADGSFHSFHAGFSWNFSIPGGGGPGSVTNVNSLSIDPFTFPAPPTAAEWDNINDAFATACPEPSTWLMVAGAGAFLVVRRRRAA
jgi:hypothetical protein